MQFLSSAFVSSVPFLSFSCRETVSIVNSRCGFNQDGTLPPLLRGRADAALVFRSGIWAQTAGLDAEWIGCKTKWWFFPNAFLRECVGLLQKKIAFECGFLRFDLIAVLVLIRFRLGCFRGFGSGCCCFGDSCAFGYGSEPSADSFSVHDIILSLPYSEPDRSEQKH